MLRVFHLLGRTPDFPSQRSAAVLSHADLPGIRITTRTIGRGGDYRNALFAAAAIHKRATSFDITHAWDLAALEAAALGARGRILFSPSGSPTRTSTRFLQMANRWSSVEMVCAAEAQRCAYLRCGAARRCDLIPPVVDASAIDAGRDQALRRALGFADDDFVVLAPGESTPAAAHRDLLWAVSILRVFDPKFRVLLWGRGSEVEALERLSRKIHQAEVLCIAERKLQKPIEFEALFGAADIAVAAPRAAVPPLALCTILAARLPLIAVQDSPLNDILQHHRGGVWRISRGTPRLLAQSILEVKAELSSQAANRAVLHDSPAKMMDGDAPANADDSNSRGYLPPAEFIERYAAIYRREAQS